LHISAPNLPGMGNISSGIFDTLKNWALSWVTSILPKFDFSSGGGTSVSIPGNVQSWIEAAMALTGTPGNWAGPLGVIAMKESGGRPDAINLTDSNAIAGHPSQGIMQMIPSTFAAHALSGHGNILNPIDNISSAIGYIAGRYGDVFHVPGVEAVAKGQSYIGYSQGGVLNETVLGTGLKTGTRYSFAEKGPEMIVPYVPSGVNLAQGLQPSTASASASDSRPIYLQIDGRTFARLNLPYTINEIRNQVGVRI